MLKEAIFEVLKTDSNIVKSWSQKYDVKEEYFVILWKRAICAFLEDGKKGCEPEETDWGIITNIFKAEAKKYLSKVDKRLKLLKNPTVNGKPVKIHYEEARQVALKEVLKEYEQEVKECCKKCKKICSE